MMSFGQLSNPLPCPEQSAKLQEPAPPQSSRHGVPPVQTMSEQVVVLEQSMVQSEPLHAALQLWAPLQLKLHVAEPVHSRSHELPTPQSMGVHTAS